MTVTLSHQKLCVFDCVELEHLLHGVVKIQLVYLLGVIPWQQMLSSSLLNMIWKKNGYFMEKHENCIKVSTEEWYNSLAHIKSNHGICAFVIVTRPFMAAVAQLQKSQPPPAVNGTSRFMGGPFKTVLLLCWAWALVMWSRKNITGRSSGRHPVAADAAILLVEYDMKKANGYFMEKHENCI